MEDWNTLEGRLRWAIELPTWREGRQRGLRLFQRRMEGRAVEIGRAGGARLEGVSLSSIQTYLNGDIVPPLRFLQEAAPVLGVREAWLVSGDGLPTEEEDTILARLSKAGQGRRRGRSAAGEALLEVSLNDRLGSPSLRFWELPEAARESVILGFDKYRRLLSLPEGRTHSATRETLADRYVEYLAAPFTILGIDPMALDPGEKALLIDVLLRPLDIVRWALWRQERLRAGGLPTPLTRRRRSKGHSAL